MSKTQDMNKTYNLVLIQWKTKWTNFTEATPLCDNISVYAGCPRRNGQNFGREFLMLNYTDITQNTYTQS